MGTRTATTGRSEKAKGERRMARALARSSLYCLLSLAYTYPDAERVPLLQEQMRRAQEKADLLPPGVAAAVAGLAWELEPMDQPALEREYLRVFSHVLSADCPPCETAYTSRHLFQQSHDLADIAGFYRAFGLETEQERPDHISVETEFMAFTAYKEAYALQHHGADKAALCHRVQRQFLESHLGQWAHLFAGLLATKAGQGFYYQLAQLTQSFIAREGKSLRAKLPRGEELGPMPWSFAKLEEPAGYAPCQEDPLAADLGFEDAPRQQPCWDRGGNDGGAMEW